MIRGQPKFDGLAVLELSASFLGPTVKLEAKTAFTNTKNGDTHGWTINTQWSPQTIEKLKELRAALEVDLGRIHLDGGGEVLVGPANTVIGPRGIAPDLGLGEHLSGDKVPSV